MNDTQRLWDEFAAALRAYIRRRVSDDHVADDLLQDVFIRIHRKLESVTDKERLSAWVFRIARNVVTDHYRSRSDVPAGETETWKDESTDDRNMNEEVSQWLVNLVAQLPDDYREVIRMSELDGVRQTEIADRIGLSVSGTKSRVQRGRRMLKELLLRCCHFDFDRNGNVIDYKVRTIRDSPECCR